MEVITMDKALSDIINEYWCDFTAHQGKNYIVTPSIPIIWFGDIEKYMCSNLKVVTIALNPSNKEFGTQPTDYFFRFKNCDLICKKITLNNEDKHILHSALSTYFKHNPYDNWFNCFEKPLNALDSSYKHGNNIAVHIDIYTALATNPTWGKLTAREKNELLGENKHSLILFKKLLKYLNPDVILYSANKRELYNAFSLTDSDRYMHCSTGSKGFDIDTYFYNDILIIKGRNNYGKPFKLKDEFVKNTLHQIKDNYKEVFCK